MSPTLDHARRLAALGLKPHWLSAPTPGAKATGKRPLQSGWQRVPYAAEPPAPPFEGANLGLRTGHVEGAPLCVVVVDLDTPEALAWAREALPSTPMRTVTGTGEHWYYRHPANGKVPNKCRLTLPDGTKLALDIRGDGGNVVVAPSVHPSGHVYREADAWDALTPDAIPAFDPAWLDGRKRSAAMGRPRVGGAEPPPPAPPSDPAEPPSERPGVLPEHFEQRLYDHLARNSGGASALDAVRRLRDGKPYAPAGERNNLLFQAARLLAEWFPDATDAQLTEFARASVTTTGDRGADAELETFADVLARARRKFAARDHLVLRLIAAGIAPTSAHTAGGEDFSRRLILSFPSGGHAILRADGTYAPTKIEGKVLAQHVAHENFLGWAERAGIAQFSFTDDEGRRHRVKWDTVLERYAFPVLGWRGSFNASCCYVDGDVFVEAVAPRRADLTPAFDADIDQWLRTLGGAHAAALLDWLATFPRLEHPTAALVLIGARRGGTNLLVEGLARLWKHGTPTPFDATTGDFNDALQRCPLLFADETLPTHGRGRTAVDAHLRELVTKSSHQLNRKYQPCVTVTGCVRVVVAMNHSRMDFAAMMNEESKDALAERLLVIDVQPAARTHLDALGGRATTERWVAGDALARHVLWLSETREVKASTRLLVEGNGTDLINRSSNRSGVNADVCQWLCSYLLDPSAVTGPAREYVRPGGGELWVSSAAWSSVETWALFVRHGNQQLPTATALGRALASLSGGRREQRPTRDRAGRTVRSVFHRVDLGQLFAWAEENGFGDVEAMRATVRGAAPPAPEPPPAPAPEPPSKPTVPDRSDAFDVPLSVLLAAEVPARTPEARAFVAPLACEPDAPSQNRTIEHVPLDTMHCAHEHVLSISEATVEPVAPTPPSTKPKRAAKRRAPAPPVREVREPAYYTPHVEDGPLVVPGAGFARPPSTAAECVAYYRADLLAAQTGHPSTYARLVRAYRAHKRSLARGASPEDAADEAEAYFRDGGERDEWLAPSLTPAPREAAS